MSNDNLSSANWRLGGKYHEYTVSARENIERAKLTTDGPERRRLLLYAVRWVLEDLSLTKFAVGDKRTEQLEALCEALSLYGEGGGPPWDAVEKFRTTTSPEGSPEHSEAVKDIITAGWDAVYLGWNVSWTQPLFPPDGEPLGELSEETELVVKNATPARWHPISTAPKDSTVVLVLLNGEATLGAYYPKPTGQVVGYVPDGGWRAVDVSRGVANFRPCDPTHWMPLPMARRI